MKEKEIMELWERRWLTPPTDWNWDACGEITDEEFYCSLPKREADDEDPAQAAIELEADLAAAAERYFEEMVAEAEADSRAS